MSNVKSHRSNVVSAKAPIEIIGYEEDTDLTKVTWNQRFLESKKKEYKLTHCQAVLFVNCARDRFRIVACFFGLAVLILPPIDPEERISLYLQVSKFLKRFSWGFDEATEMLDNEIDNGEKRLKRRQKLAATAQKDRKEKLAVG